MLLLMTLTHNYTKTTIDNAARALQLTLIMFDRNEKIIDESDSSRSIIVLL